MIKAPIYAISALLAFAAGPVCGTEQKAESKKTETTYVAIMTGVT